MTPCLRRARAVFALFSTALALPLTSARAQSAGSADAGFTVSPDANGFVNALALQGDGHVLAGGAFTTFRGQARSGVARLAADGTLDPFNPGLTISGINGAAPQVYSLALQSDGKVVVGGQFNVLGEPPVSGLLRLNADGSQDTSFDAGSAAADNAGSYGDVYALAVLPSGEIIVGGSFIDFNGLGGGCIAKVTGSGAVDAAFNAGGGGFSYEDSVPVVRAIAVLADGRMLAGGSFTAYNGNAAPGLARLNADGSYDSTFKLGSGPDGEVRAISLQADGRVLIAGTFNNFNGAAVPHIVRLNADGSLDTSYDPQGGGLFNGGLDAVVVQPDGSAVVGGVLRTNGGLVTGPHFGVARFTADGTVDASFDAGPDSREVTALALQPDGKVLAAGNASGSLVGGEAGDVFRLYDISPTPLADLNGTFSDGKITLIADGTKVKIKGNLTLINSGAKKAKNFDVTAYLAPSATFDPSVDTYLGSFHFVGAGNGKIKAGANYELPFKAKGPSDQFSGGEYLLIYIDSGNTVGESNEANNVIAVGPLPTP